VSIPKDVDLGLLLDRLSDAIIVTDSSGDIAYVNRAAERLFGWSAEELLGNSLTMLMAAEWHADYRAGLERYVRTRQSQIMGKPLRVSALCKDGAELEVEVSLSEIPRADGSVFVVGSVRDLRSRIRLERELSGERIAKDRLKFLAEAGALLDASLDYGVTLERVARLAVPRLADYCLVDILEENGEVRRVATAHRDPEKELILRTTEDRYLAARSDHPALIALRTGTTVVREGITEEVWSATAKDAEHLRIFRALAPHAWMMIPLTARSRSLGTISLVLTEPGRHFSDDDKVLAQELTRRAALAVENARLYSAERTERERLHALFMQVPAAIAIVRGPDFRYELSNPMNQQLSQGRAVVGTTVREALPEFEAQGLLAALDKVYQSGELFVGTEIPVTLTTPEGEKTIYVNGVYQPLRAPDGSIDGVMAFAYEVTAQVVARRRVEDAERFLRQALHQRDEFLSVASHELRTPLATLRLHVEMLRRTATRDTPEPPERTAIRLEKLERQIVKLEDLIRTVLDVSRITQGRLELRKEAMNLSDLVSEVVARFSEEAEEAQCVVRLNVRGAVSGCWDRVRLDQVLVNLMANAVKYGRGSPIDVEVSATSDRARIQVSDHGMGVPSVDRERIFDRFERAVSSRHYAGLGLGLWIARQIVQSHGGSIELLDTAGGGATFVVELPRNQAAAEAVPAAP
jgi:PAS domain S-box-containing protein